MVAQVGLNLLKMGGFWRPGGGGIIVGEGDLEGGGEGLGGGEGDCAIGVCRGGGEGGRGFELSEEGRRITGGKKSAAGFGEERLVVDEGGFEEIADELVAGGLGLGVGDQRLDAAGGMEGVGGVEHVGGFVFVEGRENSEAAEGSFLGASGCAGLEGPEALAFGRNGEADEAGGEGGVGGAFEHGDGVGVQGAAAFGDDESDDGGAGAGDVNAAEEVDDDAGDGFGGADIFGGVAAAVADDGGIGEYLREDGPAFFEAVLLEDLFIGGSNGAGLGGVGEGEAADEIGCGDVFPGARRGEVEFGEAVFVDDHAEGGHGGGDPEVLRVMEGLAEEVGRDLLDGVFFEDGVGRVEGRGWDEDAGGGILGELGAAAAEGEVDVGGVGRGEAAGEVLGDGAGAAGADVDPVDVDGGAVVLAVPIGEGGGKFAADVGAVGGEDVEVQRVGLGGGVRSAGEKEEGKEENE